MRISDWSSDVCSSDLKTSFDLGFHDFDAFRAGLQNGRLRRVIGGRVRFVAAGYKWFYPAALKPSKTAGVDHAPAFSIRPSTQTSPNERAMSYSTNRSEEHTSELQSLMRISYAVFCLKKKKKEK